MGPGWNAWVKVKFKVGPEAHGLLSHSCVWFDSGLSRKKQKCLGQESIVNM